VKAAGTDAIGWYENCVKAAHIGLAQGLDGVKAASSDAIGRYENGAKGAGVGLARNLNAMSR